MLCFQVAVCPARDWYQRPCLRDEAVYLFLYGDDELSTVGGLEGVCRLYFLCVAGVVFGVEQIVDRVRAYDVRVGQCVIIVIGGKDSWWGFSRSMIVRSDAVTARMSCGL